MTLAGSRLGSRSGFAVVTVLLMAVVLMALLATMFAITNLEIRSTRTSADITSGFYAAEAGLNLRGELIRREFQGYRRPSGTSPDGGNCATSAGGGDFACATTTINHRSVTTYVEEDPRNNDPDDTERIITVPPGETFAGLSAIQYRYSVHAEAVPPNDERPEALLEMIFRVRLVPMFQFAAFYDKDLEILPGPNMTLDGRVHANGDIYLNAETGNTLRINGQVTAAFRSGGTGGNVHRGRKDRNECRGNVRVQTLTVDDAPLLACGPSSSYTPLLESAFGPFQGQIRTRLDTLTVPPPEEFDIAGMYWSEADVRIALDLRDGVANAAPVVLRSQVIGGEPQIDGLLTDRLQACLAVDDERRYGVRPHAGLSGTPAPPELPEEVAAVEWSNTFRDRRENGADGQRTSYRLMLEVDTRALLDCLEAEKTQFFAGRGLGQDSIGTNRSGGLVWYLTVLGPYRNDASSGYGVRLRNAEALASTLSGAPAINGLTVVSDQAVFVQGDYNAAGPGAWRPASILADTINLLSGAWDDANSTANLASRVASSTTVNAAFLAGTDTTGDAEGAGGRGGAYNGGLENYPRLHETWSGVTLTYTGSFVSLGTPLRNSGRWPGTGAGPNVYNPPVRMWNYDTRFNDVAKLPPLSPRFVYLVQERFIREFDR